MIIGVDPGASGGITWESAGELWVEHMPTYPLDLREFFHQRSRQAMRNKEKVLIYSEKLSGVMPGNASGSVAKFSRHLGHLDMAFLGQEHHFVAPVVWMKKVVPDRSRDKQERKRQIKEKMQELYPDIKVTLWNADALGIMHYGKMVSNETGTS